MKAIFKPIFKPIIIALFVTVLFVLTVVAIHPRSAQARESLNGSFGLDVAAGWKSSTGLLGASPRYFITDNVDIHLTAGADLVGVVTGIGSRFYTDVYSDKCYFFITCRQRVFPGATLVRGNGGDIRSTENEIVSNYDMGPGLFTNFGAGFHDVYGDHFVTTLEIGYRAVLDRSDITHQAGPYRQGQVDDIRAWIDDGLTVSFALGVLF